MFVAASDIDAMQMQTLPTKRTMVSAFFGQDTAYDGIFYTGVTTTGIFCRPSCTARKPKAENIEFFATAREALMAGYRPCKRCRPMKPTGHPPDWLQSLLEKVDEDPERRWRDRDLRALRLQPERVRRWFHKHHGMTFHAYSRARRLAAAIGKIKQGDSLPGLAYEAGYESLGGFNEALDRHIGATGRGAASKQTVVATRIPTPLGPMVAVATDDALCLLEFADRRMLPKQLDRIRQRLKSTIVPGSNQVIEKIAEELGWYFDGHLEKFETPILETGTVFQEMVWAALRDIPYGTTVSYQDIAEKIERPTAVRAVARSNGDNKLAILIPCHRVVGKDGHLTGYGGGLWRKRRLLELESNVRLPITDS